MGLVNGSIPSIFPLQNHDDDDTEREIDYNAVTNVESNQENQNENPITTYVYNI